MSQDSSTSGVNLQRMTGTTLERFYARVVEHMRVVDHCWNHPRKSMLDVASDLLVKPQLASCYSNRGHSIDS